MGANRRRAWSKRAIEMFRNKAAYVLSPQQVAIGQKGGIAKFVKGIQLHMEEFPSHVAVTVDLENAFNLLRRALACVGRVSQT